MEGEPDDRHLHPGPVAVTQQAHLCDMEPASVSKSTPVRTLQNISTIGNSPMTNSENSKPKRMCHSAALLTRLGPSMGEADHRPRPRLPDHCSRYLRLWQRPGAGLSANDADGGTRLPRNDHRECRRTAPSGGSFLWRRHCFKIARRTWPSRNICGARPDQGTQGRWNSSCRPQKITFAEMRVRLPKDESEKISGPLLGRF